MSNPSPKPSIESHPFLFCCTQYFAIWAMFASSIVASKLNYESVTDKVKSASTLGYLMIASIVLIIAIVFTSNYNWRNLYALAVACVTVLLCAILIFLESKGSEMVKKMKLPILSFFAFIWAFVVIFCKYILFRPSNKDKIDRTKDFFSQSLSFFLHPVLQ